MLLAKSLFILVRILTALSYTDTRQLRRADPAHVNPMRNGDASGTLDIVAPDTLAPHVHLMNDAHDRLQVAKTNSSQSGKMRQSQAAATNASRANTSVPFNPRDYSTEVGKVFVFYFSSYSGEKVSSIETRSYTRLDQAPSDPAVFDPKTGTMLERGDCKLRVVSQTSYPSAMRKANLRLAELAVCGMSFGNPCPSDAPGCEVKVMAPLPYSEDQEPYLGAGIALVVHSLLCAESAADSWAKSDCAIARSKTGVSAGLVHAGSAVRLRALPEPWVDMKLDACYELGFSGVVFAADNEDHYFNSEHYEKKHDVLAWTREPPKPVFCDGLACLVSQFEQR